MVADADQPYALKDPAEVARRRGLLELPHIAPLIEYSNSVMARVGSGYEVPFFDPCDGGTNAQALFLLEAPGRKAMGSRFISRNNPDPSAKMMFMTLARAGIPRQTTLLWNVVPWYVGNHTAIRAVTPDDIAASLSFLKELIDLLPNLKAVVLVGKKAQRVELHVAKLTVCRVFRSPHPSQRVMNRWPEQRAEMIKTFCEVAAWLKTSERPSLA